MLFVGRFAIETALTTVLIDW